MKTVDDKLALYMKSPNQIFIDLQYYISSAHVSESDTAVAKIYAAIDVTTQWITDSGETLISTVQEIDGIIQGMPEEIKVAIASYYVPFKAQFDQFVSSQWEPFLKTYDEVRGIILDSFYAMDQDILAIEERFKDPISILMYIFKQPPSEKKESLRQLRELYDAAYAEERQANTDAALAIADKVPLIDITPHAEIAETAQQGVEEGSIALPSLPPLPAGGSWYKGDY